MSRIGRFRALFLSLTAVVTACGGVSPATTPAAEEAVAGGAVSAVRDATFDSVMCALPGEEILRVWRGIIPGRAGNLQILPAAPDFVDGGLTHAGPWDYVQDVPLFWYGPGFIRPGVYRQPVTLADIAPTQGALLDFTFEAPDGRPLKQALLPAGERGIPKLVVVVIWDSAGRNVVDQWPDAWPYLGSLLPEGAWFENASVGSSPSNTPPGHANIGTGAFPRSHGILDEFQRVGGELLKPYQLGPALMVRATFADLYDRAMGNRSVVGTVATLSGHLGMMSHGSMWGGGDRDIAIAREQEGAATGGAEGVRWDLTSSMRPFYKLPAYVNRVTGWDEDIRDLDRMDGVVDGRWREHSIADLKNGFDTPARTPFQTRLVKEVVRRERFGRDDVPDLLYLNYKAIDTVGHYFSADGIEMRDTLVVQDRDLRDLVAFLNREVGRGEWVMALTADHGTQHSPEASGAFRINLRVLQNLITRRFDDDDGVPLVQRMRPTQIWFDLDELAQNGHTLGQVARWIMGLTQGQTASPNHPPRPGRGSERVFQAAFPTSALEGAPCLPPAAEPG